MEDTVNMDELKKQFVEQVKLRAYDDKYVDRQEEKEILQLALSQGITIDSARQALAQVCEKEGYVLESVILNDVKGLLEVFNQGDGRIDEKEFGDCVAKLKLGANGKLLDAQCKRMVLELIEDNAYRVQTGIFSNWYKRYRKEVGMA